MKKLLSGMLMAGVILASLPALAQDPAGEAQKEIALGRAQLQTERQAIVAENLSLTEAQATAFWPVYREYRSKLQTVGDRQMNLLVDYAKNLNTLTDEQAKTMLNEFLSIQKEELKVKSDWVSKFSKVLPPKMVTRFYQVENKIDAIIRYEAIQGIPLVVDDKK